MSDRLRDLADRRAALELRCAAQRRAVAQEVAAVQQRLAGVDRAVVLARSVLLHPAVMVSGFVGLMLIGRVRGFRLLSRALLLAGAARRLIRLAKKL